MQEEKKKLVNCPHCHEPVLLIFQIDVKEVRVPDEKKERHWSDGLSENDVKVVEEAIATNMLQAFTHAVCRAKGVQSPKKIERFFLIFLKKARPVSVPKFVLSHYISRFKGERIQIWASEGIAVVLANNVTREFVPFDLMCGRSVHKINRRDGIKARLPVDEEELSEWTSTRFGYVEGKGAFFQNMQKSSVGAFGLPRI